MGQKVNRRELSAKTPSRIKASSILAVAKDRFARFGFAKVTMDEIAQDVGLVKGALYYYFPTKEQIFEAVIREEQDQFIDEIEILVGRAYAAGEKLRRYVEKRRLYLQRLVSLGQLDYEAWRKLKPNFQDLFQSFERRECLFLQRILEEGRRSGEFTLADPRRHARLFLRTIKGLRLLDMLYGNPVERVSSTLDQELRLFTSVFLSAIHKDKKRRNNFL